MRYKQISFYDKFKCLASDCPETCCKGWRVLLDQETFDNILNEPGKLGKKMRRTVAGVKDPYLKWKWGHCVNETKEGLCSLQLMDRQDLMTNICKHYPRRILGFGEFAEVTLELACPNVAYLFLQEQKRLSFVPMDEERPVMWTMGNEDLSFLQFLLKSREEILSILWDEDMTYLDSLHTIMGYIKECHSLIVRDKRQEAAELNLLDFVLDTKNENLFFYDFEMIDKIISFDVYDPKLLKVNRGLFSLIRAYHKIFDQLTKEQSLNLVKETMEKLQAQKAVDMNKYRAYISYVLQEMYLSAYESYHILKEVQLAFLYSDLLKIFDIVSYLEKGETDLMTQSLTLSSMEKRVRHNEGLTVAIFERIRTTYTL